MMIQQLTFEQQLQQQLALLLKEIKAFLYKHHTLLGYF